jgi:hypothetical protein
VLLESISAMVVGVRWRSIERLWVTHFPVFTTCTTSIVIRLLGRAKFVDRRKNSIDLPLIR